MNILGGTYFITSNVDKNSAFFDDDILSTILETNIHISSAITNFEIFGYKINPDHIHLLVQQQGTCGISRFMQTIKRNSSVDINRICKNNSEELLNSFNRRFRNLRLNKHDYKTIFQLTNQLRHKVEEYKQRVPFIEEFKWRKSYHCHLVESLQDYYQHFNYIKKQWVHHSLKENKFCFTSPKRLSFMEQIAYA